MTSIAPMNYLTILLFGFLTHQALCSYNEVKFTMSRSYLIDTEGFSTFKAKADAYYKYSSTFFEVVLRDPEFDAYLINHTQNKQIDNSSIDNHSNNYFNMDILQYNNYTVIFPLEQDEIVYNFSLTYDNYTYSAATNHKNNHYDIANNSFILNAEKEKKHSLYRMIMKISILNNNLIINVSNLPIFNNNIIKNTEINNANVNFTSINSIINEQKLNSTIKNKRKRRRSKFIINEVKEDPRKRFFEVSIGFTIFKKLKIKNDKSGSKIAYYPLNYKTCDFCRSSKNLSRLHNFNFKFDLEGHQNDQLFKFGKPQRKCIIQDEIDLLGNPLKFNITENATNKYTFYGFLLKIRLVKFPIYSVINDDHFALPPELLFQNGTKLNNETILTNYTNEIENASQLFHISIMPKSHRIIILLDDNNEFWQVELENSLVNHFPISVHLIGHLNFDKSKYEVNDQNEFNNFNEINFDINVNLNKDNESIIENISKIIRMYKPDIIINFISETDNLIQKDIIFDKEKIYKAAFPDNLTINLDDVLYIKSHGNLTFDPIIIDKIHQFEFSNKSIETNCGIQLDKRDLIKKRNQFSFLLPNKCKNCTFSFDNRTFYSFNESIFPSKILFKTLIDKKRKKGILPKKITNDINMIQTKPKEFFVVKNEIFHGLFPNGKKVEEFEIFGPSFPSFTKGNNDSIKNIRINFIDDCNKCSDFAKICATQYEEEYKIG